MGLTRKAPSNAIFLTVKDFSLWQELKSPVEGCDSIEVTNPKTKEVIIKHGWKYADLEGKATKLEKYDRMHNGTRYFGFKLYLRDGEDKFILDMPYQSGFLRKFLKTAPAIDWDRPLSISVFKGRNKEKGNKEELAVWFRQDGATVKPYFTKDHPGDMPPAVFDRELNEWDFRAQHRWLCARLTEVTMTEIAEAAAHTSAAAEPVEQPEEEDSIPPSAPLPDYISDDDVPF